MKIRLSTKLFVVGIAVVMISLLGFAIYRVQTNHKLYQESPTKTINNNNSTITIEKYEITEDEVNE
ncbi:MAG: hypothetical protein H6Q16_94 [Bacteroidetes bacterium]|nr:hypothetical protein [Bacteroidota bacterium]